MLGWCMLGACLAYHQQHKLGPNPRLNSAQPHLCHVAEDLVLPAWREEEVSVVHAGVVHAWGLS
jgi:hypothetical protein